MPLPLLLPGSQFSANGFSLGHSIGDGGDQKLLGKSLLASATVQVGVATTVERMATETKFIQLSSSQIDQR